MERFRIRLFSLALLLVFMPLQAQMTRNQLLKKYYQITSLEQSGKYVEAIDVCEEIASMYPRLPEPYLRMAKIYDAAGQGQLALVMYGQYVNLEMDDEAVARCLPRMKELEAQYSVSGIFAAENLQPEVVQASQDTEIVSLVQRVELSSILDDSSSSIHNIAPNDVSTLEQTDGIILRNLSLKVGGKADLQRLADTPLRIIPVGGIMEKYGIERLATPDCTPATPATLNSSFLEGRWFSSIDDSESGREYIILNFFDRGSSVDATIESESGLFNRKTDILSTSWKTIQNIWSPVSTYIDVKELRDNTTSGTIKDGRLSFNFDFTKKKKTDALKIGKNILSLVSEIIPIGAIVGKVSNGVISLFQENQNTVTYQKVLRFNLKSVTDNVIRGFYTISEIQTVNGKDKEVTLDRRHCDFYRCPQDYKCFIHQSADKNTVTHKALYKELQDKSEEDAAFEFPLAYMNYYGVGSLHSLPIAIGKMNSLASKTGNNRARYWLASICYNLSLDSEHYPLRTIRKQFQSISEKQIKAMSHSGFKYVYALQGDIYMSSGKDMRKAILKYEEGAKYGDPYCDYMLGQVYSSGLYMEKNPQKAISHLQKAAQGGYSDALYGLALCYKSGFGVQKDYSKYIKLLYEAIDGDSIEALKELSKAYLMGAGVPYSLEKALEVKHTYFSVKDDMWKGVLGQYCSLDDIEK